MKIDYEMGSKYIHISYMYHTKFKRVGVLDYFFFPDQPLRNWLK